jgi:hypothetical protein
MRIAAACAFALVLACGASAHGETDVFMRTVGFALTGNDNVEPKVIGNRASCVFAINNDLFRLDNVHTDRITRWDWSNGSQSDCMATARYLREHLNRRKMTALNYRGKCANPVPNYSNRATTPSLNMNCI